jgi:DNA-binding NarL/FixJ family response regulator
MTEFQIVVATSRPPVRAFFADMCRWDSHVRVTTLPLGSTDVHELVDGVDDVTVAVIDASVDYADALELFGAMRARRPRLPIAVLFCCPHAVKAQRLRAFVAAGAGGFLDLRLSPEETLCALQGLARGRAMFQLQLAEGSELSQALGEARPDLSDHDIGLLNLLMLGMTDGEIGRKLYLSPHTVKHRIERLRRRAHVRNRVQLAAWAAHQDGLRGDDLE